MFTNAIANNARKALAKLNQNGLCIGFYLAGDTAVAIQLGHRISVDLDFFTSTKFEAEEFANSIVSKNIGLSELQISDGTVKFILEGANVSFFYHPYLLIQTSVEFEKIHLAGLLDIGLMKISAIANRGNKKDFVDLYFISKAIESKALDSANDLAQIISSFPKKYNKVQDFYHFVKALVYFTDADTAPDPNMLVKWDWKEIKNFFVDETKKIQF